MRIAISNIAWEPTEDEAVAALLRRNGVDAIDVAPGKLFDDVSSASSTQIRLARAQWEDRGIEITGMQALLFGTSGLNVFGNSQVQNDMLRHLSHVCRIGAGLGAPRLVFGSPRNRDRTGLDDQQARSVAVSFFRRLGDVAAAEGVTICLEPNPERYGANFMTSASETVAVVQEAAHPSVRLQLDTGALAITGEDVEALLASHADLVGHVHLSEPDLVPLGDGDVPHERLAGVLARFLSGHVVTIEMLPTESEPHLVSVERALAVAQAAYGVTLDEAP